MGSKTGYHIIQYIDPADITIGRELRSGKLYWWKHGDIAKHVYNVRQFPAHREHMIYTLSQALQSQQKALKLVQFVEDKNSVYNAASILADAPERVKYA